jgi:hypothetical protein
MPSSSKSPHVQENRLRLFLKANAAGGPVAITSPGPSSKSRCDDGDQATPYDSALPIEPPPSTNNV